jgi:hypothetical protein
MPIRHHYPTKAMMGDYLRAGFGLALTGTPLLLSPAGSAAIWVLGPLFALFAVFGARTALRHRTVVEADDQHITTLGLWRQQLAWSALDEVKLNYYSTKRDRSQGWMQLVLSGGGNRVRIDSTLEGFPDVARRAYDTARAKGLELSESTVANFAALGFEPAKARGLS